MCLHVFAQVWEQCACTSVCAHVHLPWPTEQMACTHVYPRRTSAAWIALGKGRTVTSVTPVTPEGQPQPESHVPHWLKGASGRMQSTHRKAGETFGAIPRGAVFTLGEQMESSHCRTRPGQLLPDSGPQILSHPRCTLCPASLTLSPISPGSPGGPAGPGAPLGP